MQTQVASTWSILEWADKRTSCAHGRCRQSQRERQQPGESGHPLQRRLAQKRR